VTTVALARAVLARLVRPGTLARWGGGLLLLALVSVVGAGATAFDPVPGWMILAVASILTLALGARLALRTAPPPDVTGLLVGSSTRKVAR